MKQHLLPGEADQYITKMIKLRASQWDALDRLCERLDVRARKGQKIGKPSVQALLGRLSYWDDDGKEEPTPLETWIAEYFGLEDLVL